MRTNHVKAALKNGEAVYGCWLGIPSPFTTRLIARQGYGWLMIDTEHAPIDFSMMVQMIGVIADANGPAPFVRVAINSVENIKRALDGGAWGVLVPMVNTRAEAEAVVAACKYPPQGARSIGGVFAPLSFGTNRPEYAAAANDEIMVMVQIESAEAVENCEEILATPGLDLAFIGPNDLHASLGVAPRSESNEPVFLAALEKVKAAAARYHIPLGIWASDGSAALIRAQEGFQMITATNDFAALQQGLDINLKATRANP